MNLYDFGKYLVTVGVIITLIGSLFLVVSKLKTGKLWGDIVIGNGTSHFIIPIATIIVVSIIITVIMNFFYKG